MNDVVVVVVVVDGDEEEGTKKCCGLRLQGFTPLVIIGQTETATETETVPETTAGHAGRILIGYDDGH